MQASKFSAEEAAARLSSAAPAYMKEWGRCEGTCLDGKCALKWDHPPAATCTTATTTAIAIAIITGMLVLTPLLRVSNHTGRANGSAGTETDAWSCDLHVRRGRLQQICLSVWH